MSLNAGEGVKGEWRWGKKIIYLSLHCHHQNDSCIKMGSDESHFNVSLIVRDKVIRQCPQITAFEEKGEPKRIRTEIPLLTSLMLYRKTKPAHRAAKASAVPLSGLFTGSHAEHHRLRGHLPEGSWRRLGSLCHHAGLRVGRVTAVVGRAKTLLSQSLASVSACNQSSTVVKDKE